jgi:hypothetical protein
MTGPFPYLEGEAMIYPFFILDEFKIRYGISTPEA